MFQMLDNELGPESTQFAFDHFRQHSEEKTVVAKASVPEGMKVQSFEVNFLRFFFANLTTCRIGTG